MKYEQKLRNNKLLHIARVTSVIHYLYTRTKVDFVVTLKKKEKKKLKTMKCNV